MMKGTKMNAADKKFAELGDKMVGYVCLFGAGFLLGMMVFGG